MHRHHRHRNMSTSHPILDFRHCVLMRMTMTIISTAIQVDTPNDSLIVYYSLYSPIVHCLLLSTLNVSLCPPSPNYFPRRLRKTQDGGSNSVTERCTYACMHARNARMYSTISQWMDSLNRREKTPRKERRNPVPEVLCPTPTVSMFQATMTLLN